jgi:hypothetical protein
MKPFSKASEERNFTLGRCRLLRNRADTFWYSVEAPDATTGKYELTIAIPQPVWAEIEDDWNSLHESWGVNPSQRTKEIDVFGETMVLLRTARDQRFKDGVDFSQPKIFDWNAKLASPDLAVGHGSVIRPTIKLRTTQYGGKNYMQVQPVSFQVIQMVEHVEQAGGGAAGGGADNPYGVEDDGGVLESAA